MTRTHLENMRDHPDPETARAVAAELAALDARRAARATEQEQNR